MCPDVVAIGEILIDMIPTEAGHYSKVSTFKKFFGGAPFNFAVGIARLGGNAGAICAVGNDQFGEYLIDTLRAENVDTKHVKIKKARTTLAFIIRYSTGERSFFFYRKPWTETADTLLSPNDVDPEYISKAKILHFSGVALSDNPQRSAVFKAIKVGKEAGVQVSFDLNIRLDLWQIKAILRKVYDKAMQEADLILLAKDEAEFLFNTDDPEKVANVIERKYNPRCIAIKLGAKGCFVKLNGMRGIRVEGFNVPVVDTTGAGDGWAAGFEQALLEKRELEECATIANAVGALVVTKLGAITALPTREEVRSFLKEKGVNIKNF
jgi:sugar/nucleoside kinase (ribokinase family)